MVWLRRLIDAVSVGAVLTGVFMVSPWLLLVVAGGAGLVVSWLLDEGRGR